MSTYSKKLWIPLIHYTLVLNILYQWNNSTIGYNLRNSVRISPCRFIYFSKFVLQFFYLFTSHYQILQYKNAHRKNSEREKSNKQQKIQSHKIMFSAGKELNVILKMRERNKCEPIHFNCKSTAILSCKLLWMQMAI